MIAAILLALALGWSNGFVGTYGVPGETANSGVYLGPCVIEVTGTPGASCPGSD